MRLLIALCGLLLLAGCTDPKWETRAPLYEVTTAGNYVRLADCVGAQWNGQAIRYKMERYEDPETQTIKGYFPRPAGPLGIAKAEIPHGGFVVHQVDPETIHIEYRGSWPGEPPDSWVVGMFKICIA